MGVKTRIYLAGVSLRLPETSIVLVLTAFLMCLSGTTGEETLRWSSSVPKMDHLTELLEPDSTQESLHPPFSPSTSRASSWYTAHKNDPSMGFFFADPVSPLPKPRPRSLSALPETGLHRQTREVNKPNEKPLKKKKATSSSKKTNSTTSAMSVLSKQDVSTSRTFFITPLLAYMLPLFLAQMFGMTMLPAGFLLLMPVFLLPLGLTAAIFLI